MLDLGTCGGGSGALQGRARPTWKRVGCTSIHGLAGCRRQYGGQRTGDTEWGCGVRGPTVSQRRHSAAEALSHHVTLHTATVISITVYTTRSVSHGSMPIPCAERPRSARACPIPRLGVAFNASFRPVTRFSVLLALVSYHTARARRARGTVDQLHAGLSNVGHL